MPSAPPSPLNRDSILIGRQRELETLLAEFSRSIKLPNAARVLFLKGGRRMGKTRLTGILGQQLNQRRRGTIWIRPRKLLEEHNPDRWLDVLSGAMKANRPELEGRLERFFRTFTADDRPSGREAVWLELFKTCVLSAGAGEQKNLFPDLQTVWVLDDYDKWPVELKKWFAKDIAQPILAQDRSMDFRFFLNGENSILATVDKEAYWDITLHAIREIALKPLSKEEVAEFLRSSGLPEEELDGVYRKSNGIPEAVIELVEPLMKEATVLHQADVTDRIFTTRTNEQIKWICWGAHIGQLTVESLSVFGPDMEAKAAFDWLIAQTDLPIKNQRGVYFCDGPLVDSILAWHKREKPEECRVCVDRAELFHELVAVVSEPGHRELLSRLSCLKYFNDEVLQKVFPDYHGDMMALIRKAGEYFEQTSYNYRIPEHVLRPIDRYAKLRPPTAIGNARSRAADLWRERQENLKTELSGLEEQIQTEEAQLKEVRADVAGLLEKVQGREQMLETTIRKRKKRVPEARRKTSTVKRKKHLRVRRLSVLLGVSVVLCGIALLYFGILFLNEISYTYAGIGLLLIISGLAWPYRSVPEVSLVGADFKLPPVPKAELREEKAKLPPDKQMRVLNLELANRENRRSVISGNVSKMQRRISEIEQLLLEPYV